MDKVYTDLQKFMRGQVWWQVQKDTQVAEGIIFGTRPVVIISNDKINLNSPALIVAPLTSQKDKKYGTHVEFYDLKGNKSTILLEQMRTISKADLSTYMGSLPDSKMREIEKAILLALGMENTATLMQEKEVGIEVETSQNEQAEVEVETKKNTLFSDNERTMIKRYLKCHTLQETMTFFRDKVSDLSGTCLYQRIRKLKKELDMEE